MDLSSILNIYGEFGLLVLCGIVIIYLFIQNYKRRDEQDNYKNKRIEHKDETVENKFNALVDLLQKQNLEYQEQQQKNTELLIQNIINGITSHVPSSEENTKLTKIMEEIDNILQEILIETKADRVALVQYHNGGRGVNKQSFLKMSMTNEQVQLGIKPEIAIFKDQFRAGLSYLSKKLIENGFCFIEDVNNLQNVDNSMYEFMVSRDIQSQYCIAIHNQQKMIIGFITIEYKDKSLSNKNIIERAVEDKQKVVETLLSL